jgi:hypothetical protein
VLLGGEGYRRALLARDARREPTAGRVAVVGGTPEELHQLGARMVADVLEREGDLLGEVRERLPAQ